MGVYDAKLCRPVAEVLNRLGAEHVMVVHSEDGLDEISAAAPTHVVEARNGEISEYELKPEDVGLETISLDGLETIHPGLLAGGPNPNLSADETLPGFFDDSTPPALCYVDHIDSWASNENCILYNAPLVALALPNGHLILTASFKPWWPLGGAVIVMMRSGTHWTGSRGKILHLLPLVTKTRGRP